MKAIYIILFAIVCVLISCKDAQDVKTASVEHAEWLVGEWQITTAEGTAREIWVKLNDTTFSGKSFFVAGQDTSLMETITITRSGKDVFMIPTEKNQNNGQPVRFAMTSSTKEVMVFENPAHDFPQKIKYTQVNKDSLVAEVSGTEKGQQEAMQFPMGRVK